MHRGEHGDQQVGGDALAGRNPGSDFNERKVASISVSRGWSRYPGRWCAGARVVLSSVAEGSCVGAGLLDSDLVVPGDGGEALLETALRHLVVAPALGREVRLCRLEALRPGMASSALFLLSLTTPRHPRWQGACTSWLVISLGPTLGRRRPRSSRARHAMFASVPASMTTVGFAAGPACSLNSASSSVPGSLTLPGKTSQLRRKPAPRKRGAIIALRAPEAGEIAVGAAVNIGEIVKGDGVGDAARARG